VPSEAAAKSWYFPQTYCPQGFAFVLVSGFVLLGCGPGESF
jgi:hypothetical protein